MLEADMIIQLVGSLGFPIVCCIALFIRMNKSEEQRREDNHKMSETINNNTLAITKLLTKLGDNG